MLRQIKRVFLAIGYAGRAFKDSWKNYYGLSDYESIAIRRIRDNSMIHHPPD